MTRSTGEEWGLLLKWPSKHDAHCWLRNNDHQPRQPRGRIKDGYNRVQEIVSGTNAAFHTSPETEQLIAATGATLLFLAPYSPDLNPIEHDFAALKKRREYREQATLDDIVRGYH